MRRRRDEDDEEASPKKRSDPVEQTKEEFIRVLKKRERKKEFRLKQLKNQAVSLFTYFWLVLNE